MRRAAAALAVLALLGAAEAADSPLIGKEIPELSLSHPLQGEAWSMESLSGKVIVLDLFQLG